MQYGTAYHLQIVADSREISAKAAKLCAESGAIHDSGRETVARARNDCQVGALRRAVRARLAK